MINTHQKLVSDFITLNRLGPDIKVYLRHSIKVKRVSIRIVEGIPELVLPTRNPGAGITFLFQKESWIRKKLHISHTHKQVDHNIIPIFGEQYSINYIDLDHRNIQIKNDNIYVYAKESMQKTILIEFLQKKLLDEILELTNFLCGKHNIQFAKIKIMGNRTRWGSCSSKAVLRFNWRLIFAKKEILKYLVAHEISHIIEMNHSKSFWDLVEKIYPEYKIHKDWLKKNGSLLHKYLA